ncbi:MAG: CorA family divalent cation transporter [Methyloversatilis sp.]|uniref:CorA family divalent cation transporter n=1 Tax=Methyloversatilis sp. TaxID=2569862 RepID=UPI00273705AD|nr:CorA family divalent cation transporter [Methyloversatilis sp.]MDP3871720.1 CorA family divalent cation transporter [Methyloversatilis sp.]
MSRSDPPVARHFRQILMWPLRLMPLRSGDQVQRHPQALAAVTDGNPWREQRDEFTGSPADFHERHYREFVTFLPHVQRFLYGQGRSSATQPGYGESPIRVFRRNDVAAVRLGCEDGSTLDLAVQHIDLYFFYDVDVVILAMEVHADNLPLARVQELMFRFGRAFPAKWSNGDSDGRAAQCMRTVQWVGHDGAVLAESDYADRERYLHHAWEHRASCIGRHWEYLLQPMVLHHSESVGDIRYRQLEYHRLPKMTFLSFDDPFALSREDFVRLGQATQPDDGHPLPYSEQVMDEFERTACYDRFWVPSRRSDNASTRVICTGPSMVMVGKHGLAGYSDPQNGLLAEFRHQYFLIGLIAHFHRASLLMLMDRLVVAVSLLDADDVDSRRRFKRGIRQTMEIFLRFNHRYWFGEVSKQSMAKDLFDLWSRNLGNEALYNELRAEVLDMDNYLEADDSRRQNETLLRLTVVTIFGLVGTIVTGFLGMNIFDGPPATLAGKIGAVLVVTVPTVLLAFYTLKKSSALSEFFDAVSDDTLTRRQKFRSFLRIWRNRPNGRRRNDLRARKP